MEKHLCAPSYLLFEEGKYFKSCHASSILVLKDGTVLVAYFAGDHEKADNVGIWLSRCEGGAWESPREIAKVAPVAHWNPVLMEIADGVRLVFKVGAEIADWLSWTMTSRDGGCTWSEPRPYGEACGPVRAKPIRLADGRLLAGNSEEKATDRLRWRTFADVSTDDGAHFSRLAPIPIENDCADAPNYIAGAGAIQPALWEDVPEHVHAFLRTTGSYLFRSDSGDGGQSWCPAYNTGLPNNNSGIDAVFAQGSVYLVLNPVSQNWGARTPLAILRSQDGGEHFEPFFTLEDMPWDEKENKSAEFSYPAMVFDGRALHISYTYMRRSIAYRRIALP